MEQRDYISPLRFRSPNTTLIVVSVVASLVLHGAIAGAIVWAAMFGKEDIEEEVEPKMLEFEQVDLLALGEKKPPNQLPRIANPEKPTAPEDSVNLAAEHEDRPEKKEEDNKKKKDDKKKKVKDILKDIPTNPNRPTNTDVPEGRREGVAGGTATDPELASKMKTFQARLTAALVQEWELPKTLSNEELEKLAGKVRVSVKLSSTGRIISYQFIEKSGNEQFDGRIRNVLEKFSASGGGRQLPMPNDPKVTRQVTRNRLILQRWENTAPFR